MPERTPKERIEVALTEQEPGVALYELARSFRRDGMTQLEMYRLYDDYRAKHQRGPDETIYDAILDTMDCIVGWGNRSYWIFDQELDRSLYDRAFHER